MYLWIIAALSAYFIKGLCGFANTLVFTSILSFHTANANISPIDLLMGYPSNIILVWKNRKQLDYKIYLPLICLVLIGSIPGALFLKNLDGGVIKLVFGFVVIALGTEMFIREYSNKEMKSSPMVLAVIGVVSGMLCGLFGVGALLATYVGRVTDDTVSFKANISAVFIADNTVRVILYSILHIITFDAIKISILLIPFAMTGLIAGIKCAAIMDERRIRKIMAILLVLSGISLVLKNI